MLLGLLFQAFGILFQAFSNIIVKSGERLLNLYEEKVDFSKKSYSIPFSLSWLLLLYFIEVNWSYVMIIRGISIIIIAYVFSYLKEGTYLNPDTEYLLGLILLISGLFAQNEFFLFYYRRKISFYSLIYYFTLPYLMYIAILRQIYIVPGILFAGIVIQTEHFFDYNLILLISSILLVLGLKIQQNLAQSTQYSLLMFKGIFIWIIGSIGNFTQGYEYDLDYKEILKIVLLACVFVNFTTYLLFRNGQINSIGSWLPESMCLSIFIAGTIFYSSIDFKQGLSLILVLGCIYLFRKLQ